MSSSKQIYPDLPFDKYPKKVQFKTRVHDTSELNSLAPEEGDIVNVRDVGVLVWASDQWWKSPSASAVAKSVFGSIMKEMIGNFPPGTSHLQFKANEVLFNKWRGLETDIKQLGSYFQQDYSLTCQEQADELKSRFMIDFERFMAKLDVMKDFSLQHFEPKSDL